MKNDTITQQKLEAIALYQEFVSRDRLDVESWEEKKRVERKKS